MGEERLYTSGEAAEILGVTRDWLIKGEKFGNLPLARRSRSGARRYSEEDIERLRQMGVGKGPKHAKKGEVAS